MKKIPVFFTFDNNYVVPAAVAFWSMLNTANTQNEYELFVLHSDISAENQQLLQSIVAKFSNASLKFIDTKGFLQDEWKDGNFDEHDTLFTSDALVRCFGARFFPQYDKIIYSDVDVVFKGDFSELWDIELGDNYIAAVKSAFLKYSKDELSHLKPEHYAKFKDSYFAGGIWVLNLKKIRVDNLEEKMMDVVRDKTIIKRWNDQDVMNIACDNKVYYLPLNYISYPYMTDLLRKPEFESHYSKEELWDSVLNPKIVHYAAQKPWKAKVRYSDIFWDIFYYLKLPRTSIFQPVLDKYRKKYLRMKNIVVILGITVLVLSLILIGVLL